MAVPRVPIQTPMYDDDGKMTRTWVLFLQGLGQDNTAAAGGGGSSSAAAPEVTSATVTVRYGLISHDSAYGFSGTIDLPTSDPNFGALKLISPIVTLPDGSRQAICPPIDSSAFGPTTVSFGGEIQFLQDRVPHTLPITFYVTNANGDVSTSPLVVNVTVQASAVTGAVGREISGTLTVDPFTRLLSTSIGATPTLQGNQVPQNVTYLVSEDNGVTYESIGVATITTVGQEIVFQRVKPSTTATWKVALVTGFVSLDASLFIPAANLPTGAFVSAGFSVTGISAPSATTLPSTAINIPAGSGPSHFPYDKTTPDGLRYWEIPTVSLDDTGADLDDNAFFLRITCQDLDASHNPVGPEHAYAGDIVHEGGVVTIQKLDGDYGTDGFSYVRSGNIAYVRFRLYLISRADQSTDSFSGSAATLQTHIGGGAGYVDILVANGGAIPPGALVGPRVLGNVPGADVATTALNASSLTVATSDGLSTIQIDPSRVVDINSPATHESIKFTRSSISFAVTSPTLHVAEYGAGGIRANGSTWLTDTGDFVINRLIGFNQYFVAGMGLPPIIQAFGPQALGQGNAAVNNFIYVQRVGDASFGAKNPIPAGLYRFTYSMSFLSGAGSGFAEVTIQSFDGLKNLIQSTPPLQASGFQAAVTGSLIFYTNGTRDTQWALQFVNTAGMAVVLTWALEKLT